MRIKFLKNISSFLLIFLITVLAISFLSSFSKKFEQPKLTAGAVYNLQESKQADEPEQKIQAVVKKESNIWPSVAAFSAITCVPLVYLVFAFKKVKKNPSYFREGAQRYSPKKEITFNNNTLDTDYTRSRM